MENIRGMEEIEDRIQFNVCGWTDDRKGRERESADRKTSTMQTGSSLQFHYQYRDTPPPYTHTLITLLSLSLCELTRGEGPGGILSATHTH